MDVLGLLVGMLFAGMLFWLLCYIIPVPLAAFAAIIILIWFVAYDGASVIRRRGRRL